MQAPSPFRLPVLGSQLTDGRRYPRQMPKSGKRQPDKKSDPLPVVAILQKSLRALFKYAKDIPALHNRRNSVALQNWMREQPQWGDSVSKSHINRIENGEGPVGIDVVDMIARAFGYDAWELLHPSFEPRSEAERNSGATSRRSSSAAQRPQERRMARQPTPEELTFITILRAQRVAKYLAHEVRGPQANPRQPRKKARRLKRASKVNPKREEPS
jgi:transcriptional regulator with XRE-family HTH domain